VRFSRLKHGSLPDSANSVPQQLLKQRQNE
jgi:hypothetical protein